MALGQKSSENVKFYLAYDISQLPVGTRFIKNPPHITQTPPAVIERERMPEVEAFLQEFAGQTEEIALTSLGLMFVGHRNEPTLATRFDKTPELDYFHRELISQLDELGCEFVSLDYANENYKPHSEAILLDEGGRMTMSNTTIHTKRPHPLISGLTEITSRYELGD